MTACSSRSSIQLLWTPSFEKYDLLLFLPFEWLIPFKNVPPITTFSLIQELIHRDGLRGALSGRDDILLEPVLRLLVKHVTDPRFGEMVCDISILLIGRLSLSCVGTIMIEKKCITPDMYAPVLGQSPLIDSLFLRLRKKVIAEIRFQKELMKAKGTLEIVFSSAALVPTQPLPQNE